MHAKRGVARAQSAMEYLATYGWAILIIAVVLATLFSLGIFSPGNFAPKASPGSCQVYRPGGPLSISGIALTGLCNGELPEYAANFPTSSSVVTLNKINGLGTSLTSNAPFSASLWLNLAGFPGAYYSILTYGNPSNGGWYLRTSNSGTNYIDFRFNECSSADCECSLVFPLLSSNTWYYVVITYNGVVGKIYFNGQSSGSATCSDAVTAATPQIGGGWLGYLSNVQIYNTSLSANEIQYLYTEGIGGAPLVLQNLVGWWPLNGNTNDYSGDNLTGKNNGATFTSSWTSGYTAP